MRYILWIMTLTSLATFTPTASADIEDLGWMVGRWSGNLGTSTLEETWNKPLAGSMVAIVRSSSSSEDGKPAATNWIEVISIIEEDDGLMLRLQQFTPEMEPRFPAQPLKMSGQTERSVTFEAIGEGGLKTITYSRPTPNEFLIDVLLSEGGKFVAPLKLVDE